MIRLKKNLTICSWNDIHSLEFQLISCVTSQEFGFKWSLFWCKGRECERIREYLAQATTKIYETNAQQQQFNCLKELLTIHYLNSFTSFLRCKWHSVDQEEFPSHLIQKYHENSESNRVCSRKWNWSLNLDETKLLFLNNFFFFQPIQIKIYEKYTQYFFLVRS